MNISTNTSLPMAAASSPLTPSASKRLRDSEEDNQDDLDKRVKTLMKASLELEFRQTEAQYDIQGLFHSLDQMSAIMERIKPSSPAVPPVPVLPTALALPALNFNALPTLSPSSYSQGPKSVSPPALYPIAEAPAEIINLTPLARLVSERIHQWKERIKENCTTFIKIYHDRVKHTNEVFYPTDPKAYTLTQGRLESDIKEVPALLAACEDVPDNVRHQLKATMETWRALATEMIEPFDPIVFYNQLFKQLPAQSNFLSFQIFYGNRVLGYVPDKPMQAYFHLFHQDFTTRDHDEITPLFQRFYNYKGGTNKSRNNIVFRAKLGGPVVDYCYYMSSVPSFFNNQSFHYYSSFKSENRLFQFYSPPYKLCRDPIKEQQLAAGPVDMHINILSALKGLREAALFALASKNDQELDERLPHARSFADKLTALIPLEQLLPEYQALVHIGAFVPALTSALNFQVDFKPMHTLLCIRIQEPHPRISIQIYLKLLASALGLHVPRSHFKNFNICSDLDKFAEKLMHLYNEICQKACDLEVSLETHGRTP